MPKKKAKVRVFSRAFKQAAVERMLAGENVCALARELKLRRKLLYEWKDRLRQGGPEALHERGRPRKQAAPPTVVPATASVAEALAKAQQRIAELERKVGRQTLELDFFVQALRHIEGATAATDSSQPSTSKRRKAN